MPYTITFKDENGAEQTHRLGVTSTDGGVTIHPVADEAEARAVFAWNYPGCTLVAVGWEEV